jgi:hypothetical protein
MMDAGARTVIVSFVVEGAGWIRVRWRETCAGSGHLHSWGSVERAKVQKNKHMRIGCCGCAGIR